MLIIITKVEFKIILFIKTASSDELNFDLIFVGKCRIVLLIAILIYGSMNNVKLTPVVSFVFFLYHFSIALVFLYLVRNKFSLSM